MAAYISVPRDLTRVKSKVLFGLTKRQLICFGTGALIGVPVYFFVRAAGNLSLAALAMGEDYGYILRAKGMVPCDDGQTWLHFDLVPEEFQIREGAADYTGRLCVIGSDLKEDQLEKLFLLA